MATREDPVMKLPIASFRLQKRTIALHCTTRLLPAMIQAPNLFMAILGIS